MPYDNAPASADLIVLIEGLETNIEDKSNHFTCPKSNIKVLEKPSNAFEVLMEGTPCRLFVDVDGEMSADTDEATFKQIVAEVQHKFCADDRIIGVRSTYLDSSWNPPVPDSARRSALWRGWRYAA